MNARHPTLLALTAAMCAAAGTVHAQSTPYYIGVSQSITHESNIYRSRRDEQSDTVSTTALFGGVDQSIGRQRVYGNATVSANRFMDNGDLNNTGYLLKAGLDWSTIERVSGNVEFNTSQSLARYDTGGSTDKNRLRDTSLSAVVRVGVVTRLTAEAGYTHRSVDYSLKPFNRRNFDQNGLSLGLRYRFSGALTGGIAARFTKGSYPDLPTPDDYDRRDIDFTGTWVPSGNSTVNGRVSLSSTSHSARGRADFSGVTGQLSWDWRPTGRLRVVSTLARDTGEEYSLETLTSDQVLQANSRVTTSVGTRVIYEVSSKVNAELGARFARRSFDDRSGVTTANGTDNTTVLTMGLRWTPLRSVTLGCNVSRESRSASSTLRTDYDYNSFGCFGQLALQL